MNVLVLYFSKGGNTRRLAEAVAGGVRMPRQWTTAPNSAGGWLRWPSELSANNHFATPSTDLVIRIMDHLQKS
jgi:hypothetical protein